MSKRSSNSSRKSLASRIPLAWSRRCEDGIVVVRWKFAVIYLLLVILGIWASAVGGIYLFVKYRVGFSEVRVAHIAGLPFTLDTYRTEKGQFWVRQGMIAAENNLWYDAFGMLQQGLPFDPANQEARMLLARIYVMAGRPEIAASTLVEGLDYKTDQMDYVRTVISVLFSQQADEAVVEMADRLLKAGKLDGAMAKTVESARVYALFNRDQTERLEELLKSGSTASGLEGKFIQARLAWERGNRETAITMLRSLNSEVPKETEIYRTLTFYLREVGRTDESRRLALGRTFAFPDEADGYLDVIYAAIAEKNPEALAKGVDDFLKVFAEKQDALVRLALLAGSEGLPDIAWRVVALCPENSVQVRNASILALEAELTAKRYTDAEAKAAKILAEKADWPAWQRQIIQGLQGVAWLGLGKTTDGQGALARVLDRGSLPPAAFASMAKQIRRAGDSTLAARFYRRALSIDASQGGALVDLLEIELEAGTLEQSLDLVEKLPDVRKPSPVFMRRLIDQLESDRYIYVPARVSAIDKLQRRLVQMRAVPRS